MKQTRKSRRDARHLFRLCLVKGLLDDGRVRQVVQRVTESSYRNRFKVLSEFLRLVKLDRSRHTATVESATPLPSAMQAGVQAGLSGVYGPGLNTSFIHSPALIGGMRIRVASDLYDGSVKARLAALEARF
jgi:F-type H+-transporting ATPase subunit delta